MKLRIVLSLLVIAALTWSCNEIDDFASDLLEDNTLRFVPIEQENYTLSSIPQDSLVMLNEVDSNFQVNLSVLQLGEINDPLYGYSKAAIYSEFVPYLETWDFPNPIVDSVVLKLQYDTLYNLYGDPESRFNINVYELTEPVEGIKYHFESLSTDLTPIGQLNNFKLEPIRTVQVEDTVTGAITEQKINQFRIPISNAFGEKIVALDSTVFDSLNTFKEVFKGLKIEPSLVSGQGSMAAFQWNNLSSTTFTNELIIYYRNVGDTTNSEFRMTSIAFDRYNEYTQDRNSGSIGDDVLAIENMGGTLVKLEIPYSEAWDTLNLSDAFLEITNDLTGQDTSIFFTNNFLRIFTKEDGRFLNIIDYNELNSLSAFSQTQLSLLLGNIKLQDTTGSENATREYFRLKFPQHARDKIRDKENIILYIYDPSTKIIAHRSKFYGRDSEKFPAKLIFIHTINKIKDE